MKKFIVLYHVPMDSMQQTATMNPKTRPKRWRPGWRGQKKCGDKLVDPGSPLINGQQLAPNGQSRNSDKNVAGYSVLQAENMEEAKAILKGHPHLGWNAACTI